MKTLLMIIGMMGLTGSLMATEFAEPVDHDVKSANGKFNLHVSVKDGIHEVTGGFGPKGGWKFQSEVSFNSFILSDDGESVAEVDWAMCKIDELDEPAVVIHGRDGVRGTFSYRELSVPRKLRNDEVGPIGDFWRVWRGSGSVKGNLLTIEVEGRKPCVIDLQTAKLKSPPAEAPATEPPTPPEKLESKLKDVEEAQISIAALAQASLACADDDSDNTLRFYLSKSELVVSGRIASDPMGIVDKKGSVAHLCQFKVDDVVKGDATLKGTVIWVSIGLHEVGEKDKHPLIRMDGECLLFLKSSPQNSPTWVTVDSWFGIQHPWPSLIGALRRLVAQAPTVSN